MRPRDDHFGSEPGIAAEVRGDPREHVERARVVRFRFADERGAHSPRSVSGFGVDHAIHTIEAFLAMIHGTSRFPADQALVLGLHCAGRETAALCYCSAAERGKRRMNRFTNLFFGIGAAVIVACGSSGSEFDSGLVGPGEGGPPVGSFDDSGIGDASITSLEFDPPSATLALDGKTPESATFKLLAHLSNGGTVDVKAESLSFDRPDLAQTSGFGPVTCTAGGAYAGVGTLQAIVGKQSASATLTITVHIQDVGAGVTPQMIQLLDGATTQDPQLSSLLYPYDATVFPLGLSAPLVMWNAPANNEAYKVHSKRTCTCSMATISCPRPRSSASIKSRGIVSPRRIRAIRSSSRCRVSSGNTAYQSAHESFTIVNASLRGAIYYWTTSGAGHMSRIRPGTGAVPEVLERRNVHGMPRRQRRRIDARRDRRRSPEHRRHADDEEARMGVVRFAERERSQDIDAVRRKPRRHARREIHGVRRSNAAPRRHRRRNGDRKQRPRDGHARCEHEGSA